MYFLSSLRKNKKIIECRKLKIEDTDEIKSIQ